MLNKSAINKDIAKCINESSEYTFADWFGQDLTGETYDGDVPCRGVNLTSLKGAPKIVNGDFDCSYNQLTSLEGAPEEVSGGFYCSDNQLTSLKGAPKEVGGDFNCDNNQLVTLGGCPEKIDGYFSCDNNQLVSLEGAPKEIGDNSFSCSDNKLTSLKGCPEKLGGGWKFGGLDCQHNKLTSLEGGPKEVDGKYWCTNNEISSLNGFPDFITGDFFIDGNHAEITDFTDFNIHKVKGKILFDDGVVIPRECKVARGDKKIHGTKINQILRKLDDVKNELIYSGYQDDDEEMKMINSMISRIEGKRNKK